MNKKPSPTELMVSITVLALLLVICIWVGLRQNEFNPAVNLMVALQADLSEKPLSHVPESAKTFTPPDPFAPMSPPERFNEATLSEKINGKAELYLSAGFRSLVSRRFTVSDDPVTWYEMFLYEMKGAENAFAVYSSQRRDDAAANNITRFAYMTANAFFFIHGHYYIEIVASDSGPEVPGNLEHLAEAFVEATPVPAYDIKELRRFPPENLDASSLTLIWSDAFGYEGLDRIYKARYSVDGSAVWAFLSNRENPDDAEELASKYQDFLLSIGGNNLSLKSAIPNIRCLSLFDTIEIIFTHGSYIAGIHEAYNQQSAQIMAERLYHALKNETQSD